MQTLTFTQKLLRQHRFLSPLSLLFALLIGLGATTAVRAQTTINFRNVIVTAGTSSANATTNTYNAAPTATGTAADFDGTNFGSFDLATGRLLLQGGSIEIVEAPGESYAKAFVNYGIKEGAILTTTGAANIPALTNVIELTQTNYNAGTRTRTFSLGNAARNILALAPNGGGAVYRFDVSVSTGPGSNPDGDELPAIAGVRRKSVFTATGVPLFTPTLTATTVLISPSNGPNVSYDASNVSANTDFNGANLGTFNVNTGQLVLNGGTATTTENGPNNISSVTLYYRVRTSTSGGGGFAQVALTEIMLNNNPDGSRTRSFALSTAAQNLLAGISMTGTYNVDVNLQASGVNTSTNITFNLNDNNGGINYTASFLVNGTPFATTVWTGGVNDNWFDPLNWTNGVPNAITNAIVPNFASGSSSPYPNVYSNTTKPATPATTITLPDGTVDVVPASPGYNNSTSGNAQVRNLTLQGSSQLDRSILRLVVGRLDVFGDFTNPQGSFIQRSTPIISFKADGNQTISGSPNGFSNIEIDGGVNSIKTLVTNFDVRAGGYLKFINGILATNTSQVSTNFITLEGTITDPTTSVVTPAAQLLGETNVSYFRGFLKTTQTAVLGTAQNFSNIGLTLTFTKNEPGAIFVTRNNGDNYPSSAFGASPPSTSGIRRVFGVQPGNPNTNTGGLAARVEFRYLTNELSGLRTANGSGATFNGSVDQARLALYVSTTGGNSFSQLGRDSNSNNTLVKNGVVTFATFTLSEQQNNQPLPVEVVTFDAKRSGADALVTWETASELNSKGYNVQVSTNGTEFRTVAFIASASPNSVHITKYSYIDIEKNKAGLRYYRLEQVDIDGTLAYFGPRVVSFAGKTTENGATAFAYPNPFTNQVSLSLQSPLNGQASVRISDMTGRTVAERQVALVSGNNEVALSSLGDLKGGLYLMHVTLPSGLVQKVKVAKQ